MTLPNLMIPSWRPIVQKRIVRCGRRSYRASCAREGLERDIVPASCPQPALMAAPRGLLIEVQKHHTGFKPAEKEPKRDTPLLAPFLLSDQVAIVVNDDAIVGFYTAWFACFASCSNSFSSFVSALYRMYMIVQMMAWPTAKMPATNAISAGASTQPAA